MISDKELKKNFREEIKKHPEKYFPIQRLKELGFSRYACKNCKKDFWSVQERDYCGEPECEGGYSFIGKKREDVDFLEVWKRFSSLMKKQGYTPIKRYPSVSRWNPTMDFTLASIADFQPYVVSGEVEPPANPLVVPQTCIRFNDIDNVGITGRHYTGFTMIGQHAFMPKEKFDQPRYFQDYLNWYTKGMKLKHDELVIHEDSWAGGGNFGPCLEFFSKGLEIGNQVYMYYEITASGQKELKLKVLDMGMGQERPSWYLSGTATSYEVNFPTACTYLLKKTGIRPNQEIMQKFIPYSGLLNIDEIDDVDASWKAISKKIGHDVADIKNSVLPLAALYSIADHTRTLLYTITDGALPGNVGGGYNLRVLYRRMQSFLEKYDWNIDLDKVMEIHAAYLKPQYPEFAESLELVKKILAVEQRKYLQNKERNRQILEGTFQKQKTITEQEILRLYDSNGITPEEIQEEVKKRGLHQDIPENFYAKVSSLHEKSEEKDRQLTQTRKEETLDLDGLPETSILYYDHYDCVDFDAFVLKIIGKNRLILDKTAFYPTSGGQLNDVGTIDGHKVIDVFKQGNIVIHALEYGKELNLKKGDKVRCHIDLDRRIQLAQHHTAAHILNGACRTVLGEHIWQAGAAKTVEKGRLDITHYDSLTDEESAKIEELANRIIKQNLPVFKSFMPRNMAEKEYGFRLYQGGAVPGKNIRVVEIKGFDVEACGGTHLNLTGDVSMIKIIRTAKIQDGVVRIEYVAGKAAENYLKSAGTSIEEITKLLNCTPGQVPGRAAELFQKWKAAKKAREKKGELQDEFFRLTSSQEYSGDVLGKAAEILKTQKEHLPKTIRRFKEELESLRHP
ncbi:MAG: alanine--tRNA ligase [Nanoarchaeota archaeon]